MSSNLCDALEVIVGRLQQEARVAAAQTDSTIQAENYKALRERATAVAEICRVISEGAAPSISVAAYAFYEGRAGNHNTMMGV